MLVYRYRIGHEENGSIHCTYIDLDTQVLSIVRFQEWSQKAGC
jgi:hypothetical protein